MDNSDIEYIAKMYREVTGQDKPGSVTIRGYADGIREYFENVIACMPGNVYWTDKNSVYLGCNDNVARALGLPSRKDIIGKTNDDLKKIAKYTTEKNDTFEHDNLEVIATGKPEINEEDPVLLADGKEIYYLTNRMPLFDENNNTIGVVGISIDITDRKEKEQLQLENEHQQAKITEQEIFRTEVGKLIHDVSTPIGTINLILNLIKQSIPESERISLVDAVGTIRGLMASLLSKYRNKDEDQGPQPTLISLFIAQVLEVEKINHTNLPIEFTHDFNDCNFSFLDINQFALKRSIANLINNAVDAIESKGIIHVGLNKKDDFIAITIQDNGKGMSQDVLEKLKNNIAITSGKKDGHGIGFTQIQETVKNNHGTISIESVLNQGTTITITFPGITPPDWFVKELRCNKQDIVVVLDDDSSIHGAWDAKFQQYKDVLSIKHFRIGSEAVAFINSFSDKSKIFLLADFELLGQKLNGIDVIRQTNVRSVLVTSHYSNKEVLKLVEANNIKILPKQLSPEVSIVINDIDLKEELTRASIVIADEGKNFVNQLASYLAENCKVKIAKYYDVIELAVQLAKCAGTNICETFYPKNTKFFINSDFKNSEDSLKLAKLLYDAGYTKLYIISGREFHEGEVPQYLTVILKPNIDEILRYASEAV